MKVDVVWEPFTDGCSRGFYDQAIVERLLAGRWTPPGWPGFVHHDTLATVPDGSGAVVIVPARHHAGDIDQLNVMLAPLPWVLLILNGDEEGAFRADRVSHPNLRMWVQTPQPGRTYPANTRWLPNGPTPAAYDHPWGERTRDVVFAGQVTHSRREECAAAVQGILDAGCTGTLVRSAGFTQGLPQSEYLALMASARVCPAPSGPVHVDSFRAWEAMELGAIPFLDMRTPDGRAWPDYWHHFDDGLILPLADTWDPGLDMVTVDVYARTWPSGASRTAAWWMDYQRRMAIDLMEDLAALTGQDLHLSAPDDMITVLMPTSPIPSHPDTSIIRETIASIRAQLPTAEILVMCDGVRAEQEARRPAYETYLYELVRLCREEWTNVLPVIYGEHLHQSEMTRRTLDMVTTPTIMFVEHDCPIRGSIPWPALVQAVRSSHTDVVRLHHEASILAVHEYLMCGPEQTVSGARMRRTFQWSQRPHLARTAYYRQIIRAHFQPGEKSMIEDRMHSVAQSRPGGHRLRVLTEPNGEHGIRRSWHLDGRASDEKWTSS